MHRTCPASSPEHTLSCKVIPSKYTTAPTVPSAFQVLLLLRQMESTNTQATASKVSLLMLGQQAVIDAYLCLLHLTTGRAWDLGSVASLHCEPARLEAVPRPTWAHYMPFASCRLIHIFALSRIIWQQSVPVSSNLQLQLSVWQCFFLSVVVLWLASVHTVSVLSWVACCNDTSADFLL